MVKKISDIRKQEILQGFYDVIGREGFEGASFARIAEAVGVHPSLIGHYFKTKDAMTAALFDFVVEKYERLFYECLEGLDEPQKRFDALMDVLFGKAWADAVDERVFNECHTLSLRDERYAGRFRGIYLHFRSTLIDELEAYCQATGRGPADLERIADLLIAVSEGVGYYAGILEDTINVTELSDFARSMVMTALDGESKTQ